MAQASYNPEAAVGLWERMEKAAEGRTPPEWLSTHPSPSTRITDLRAWMPQALTYFKPPGQSVAMLPSIPGASHNSPTPGYTALHRPACRELFRHVLRQHP